MWKVGRRGEEMAASHLSQKGYKIIERNWRCRSGEIDIIAVEGSILAFIEVKARRSHLRGSGLDAVDRHKQNQLRRLALQYIYDTGTTARAYRFDVVSVDVGTGDITVVRNAF